ncbi:Os07g0294250, partial [Oryza sativa Japonica Group]
SALSHPPVTSLARRRWWLEGRRRPNSGGGSGASYPLDLAGSGSPAGGEAGVAAAGGGWREGGGLTAEAAAAPPLRQIWPGAVARHEGRRRPGGKGLGDSLAGAFMCVLVFMCSCVQLVCSSHVLDVHVVFICS